MGTIVIEQYEKTGLTDNSTTQVYNLSTLRGRDEDSTTSTTAESVTIQESAHLVRIYTDEIHRIALSSADTADDQVYSTTIAGGWVDYGVEPGDTLYYRTDS